LILLGVTLTAAAVFTTGCTEEYGERCNGQTIESWRSGNLSGGRWEPGTTCSDDEGEVCRVFDATSPLYPQRKQAFCVIPTPDPACKGMTGRFCGANNSILTCVKGLRVARGFTYFDRCPAYLNLPHCHEAVPGVAFCVEDETPSSLCAGQTPRPMTFCASGTGTCREVDVVQYCADATTSVTCLGGVVIDKEACDLHGGGNGTCMETTSVEGGNCTYASP
jgi:hypothetical protein